ncbi:MAG: hypothetical protein JXB36_10595 [Gammaproteobacteria bacterium]|nr:hypothetical protein [Gammaproteobacteria bacterium]
MSWLTQHSDVISAAGTVGMFLVWVVYAQMFYKDYRRRRRPRILIDDMAGPGAESTCTVVNLSSEIIYLERIIAVVETANGDYTAPITERTPISSSEQPDREIVSLTRQGPIPPGELISIGTLEDMVNVAMDVPSDADTPLDDVSCVEVRVVATMSSEDNPVGAYKRFQMLEQGERSEATTLGTHQMYKRREKQEVMRWLRRR